MLTSPKSEDTSAYLPSFQLQMSATERKKKTLLGENCVTNERTTVSEWRALHKESAIHTLAAVFNQEVVTVRSGHKDEMELRCQSTLKKLILHHLVAWRFDENCFYQQANCIEGVKKTRRGRRRNYKQKKQK